MNKYVTLLWSALMMTVINATVGVSCKEKDEKDEPEYVPQLEVNTNEVSLSAARNSRDTLLITSDTNWTVSSSESWLAVSLDSASRNDTVVVTAEQNTAIAERTTTVTVSASEEVSQLVTVTQSGVAMVLSRSSFDIEAGANSSDTFAISSNKSWTVSSGESWLTVSPESGSGNGIVTVTATEPVTISQSRTATVTVTSEDEYSKTVRVSQEGIPCGPDDETPCLTSGCSVPEMPAYAALPTNEYLPDPFTFMDGTPVTTVSDWTCRREEIAVMAQEYEYGYKPCTPYEATTTSFSGNTLTITVTENGKAISFECSITYPTSGSAPYPAMIGIGFSFLNNTVLSDQGVAIISFPNDEIAEQNGGGSRGRGKFYDLFCNTQSAGALMAWSWGVSRLIDALEKTPEANIDATRLGVTGCSRNGKGALCAGAFDERIALTIPQEAGSGGSTSWRVSDYMLADGQNTQTLSQITGENVWFRQNFSQFSSSATRLPFDQHMVQGLIAPRALLMIENDILWLGPESSWTCANAAHTVWEALGVPDRMGYSGSTAHGHCSYIEAQVPELEAYVARFLVGNGTDDTHIMNTELDFDYNEEMWVNWTVPDLD